MKRLIALITTGLLITSSFAFAATNNIAKIDTSIGTLKKDQPLAEFVVNMDKLTASIKAEKQSKAIPTAPQKRGLMAMAAPKVEEPKIIIANDLPENNLKQILSGDGVAALIDGQFARVPANQVNGKSVTITKKQLMEADMVIMENTLLKNFRVIGKAKDGGDIMAIDVLQTNAKDMLKKDGTTFQVFASVNAKNEPDGIKTINGTNVVPPHGEYPLSYYTADKSFVAPNVNVGQWYTIVWGNSLEKWTAGTGPYSLKDFNYLAIQLTPTQKTWTTKTGLLAPLYAPATNATQLIITELDK